jgi:hypothetical protein
LPEVEDLTMHLATLAGLPHPLFRLAGGALAYVTQHQGQKLALVLGDVSQAADRKSATAPTSR